VHHQDIFGGNGAVGFELKAKVAIGFLEGKQGVSGFMDRLIDLLIEEGLIVRPCDFSPIGCRFHGRREPAIDVKNVKNPL
jgi:hypothetical protein